MGRREYWRLVDNQGRPPGLLGMWPSRAVTFLENHDTGMPFGCRSSVFCTVLLHHHQLLHHRHMQA